MSLVRLSDYFFTKYAATELEADTSFGVSISPERTRILKDKLIAVYDKLDKKITQLPSFKQLNKELEGSPYLTAFRSALGNFIHDIENSTLKEGFSYSIRIVEALNQLRTFLRSEIMEKDKKVMLDLSIKNIQDTIWKESKRILNIHDLRGLTLEYPELEGILKEQKIVPTWDYGPLKSHVKKPIKQQDRTVSELMKRLQKEIEEEKK